MDLILNVKLLEVFVVELYILKRGIGAYKNSNIIVVLVFSWVVLQGK